MKSIRGMAARKRVFDDRQKWVSEDQDLLDWVDLTRGARSRRLRFFHLVSEGIPSVDALKEVLDLHLGPIPGFQTQDEFDRMWSLTALEEIALRWQRSPHFKGWAKDQTEVTRANLASWAPAFANTLKEVALDKDASSAARVKAAQIGLGLAGLVHGEGIPADVKSLKEYLKKRTRETIQKVQEPLGEDDEPPQGAEPA